LFEFTFSSLFKASAVPGRQLDNESFLNFRKTKALTQCSLPQLENLDERVCVNITETRWDELQKAKEITHYKNETNEGTDEEGMKKG
jgi:hypothetical protein